ncbi:unnamed protein product [Rhizoctonia solani]|uniref:Laminin domain protein n=1 Tax=Rhizoctonia solani TaxID=456999 RepID=A0A8H3DGZ1_9AGAM|nr:unnamed protein product [Rhizoctonia solani]
MMKDHTGWYPPGQVCSPPELPSHFKDVPSLKPIVGVPSDAEVIEVHSVIHAANRVSGVPGMHDPVFFMKLADHLFNVQMARYRSRYSLLTFPNDATYTPPAIPSHISINLESVSGAPSDNAIIKVQDAIQTYQELRRIPSMFDARVNMELSQHLFDLQMARHMRIASESQPRPMFQGSAVSGVSQTVECTPNTAEEPNTGTNNAGRGANTTGIPQAPQSSPGIDVRELMDRSNQLAERCNQLLEHSNELIERRDRAADEPVTPSWIFAERFNQVLERLTQLVERTHQPAERSDRLIERFNELFERFNQLAEQSSQPAQRANKLAERSNELADRANQLAEKLNQLSERSNQLALKAATSIEQLAELLKNTNRVLAGVQHAIVRNHKGNTLNALECLVNEKGETPVMSRTTWHNRLIDVLAPGQSFIVMIDGVPQKHRVDDEWLGEFVRFYGIDDGLFNDATTVEVKQGKINAARDRLSKYLGSCLG